MEQIFQSIKNEMQKTVDYLNQEYVLIQAGRANPAILSTVTVDYYGTPTPISQVAAISVAEARVLNVQPWDISIINSVEKAIQKADLGINPQNDGKIIRLIFPQLTEDRRKEISKEISKLAEEAKIRVRNIRHEGLSKLKNKKKNSEITEDDQNRGEKKIQEFTDKFCAEIESICNKKIKQIMEI